MYSLGIKELIVTFFIMDSMEKSKFSKNDLALLSPSKWDKTYTTLRGKN